MWVKLPKCENNNLVLNTNKTKEIIVDFRRTRGQAHAPVFVNGAMVEQASGFNFLCTHISEDLSWSRNISVQVKKVQQCLYFLQSLKKANLCSRILLDLSHCPISQYGMVTAQHLTVRHPSRWQKLPDASLALSYKQLSASSVPG